MPPQQRSPLLLTPGPLTTAATTKRAMLRDWGSRDKDFIALTQQARDALPDVAGATAQTQLARPPGIMC